MIEDNISISNSDIKSTPDLGIHLLSDTDFSDVTLVSEDGQHLVAHRAVLAQGSPFLRSILYESLQQRTFLYLGTGKADILQELLKFLYLGQCQVPKDSIDQLVQLARQLKIAELEKALVVVEKGGKEPENNQQNKQSTNEIQIIQKKKYNSDILKHKESDFNVENGFLCQKLGCHYRASRKRELPKHQASRRCPLAESNTMVCHFCNEGGKTPKSLAYHFERMRCEKQFCCNGCGDTFRLRQQLKEHMMETHMA